ncbi:P-loop containing nucleoside triphosphate hydrolase protein [Rhodocollybia butyracea]|uniref:DNA 3'-5' helicase n=1 Tax=Rhodocollybia butyracea TaxID=206335 RepID=A0A9P5PI83_9AGAR|nr:P-loop containing nucleoside triphosphate hydrolase protein [Rhodocollybia butyracea]
MPPKYPQSLDEGRLDKAEKIICEIFDVPGLRELQQLAGRNILQGKTTVYDVPTGGGKTLAFWYPLAYGLDSKDDISVSQKVVLVVEALEKRGIPALAVNNKRGSGKMEDTFEIDEGGRIRVKYRAIFVSPETAVSTPFHEKVGLPLDSARIAVSNAKYNITLSVRILQHPNSTYADLFTLFPTEPDTEFPQTLIYVNHCKEAEEIQDFFRRHCPLQMPADSIEFYHRFLTDKRKTEIAEGLRSGHLRCVIATDALGMGMDFLGIKCVILWHEPLTFLSLVQKIGRGVRQLSDLGEAILFLTKASYTKHLTALESERDEEEDGNGQGSLNITAETGVDRIAVIDQEDLEPDTVQHGKKKQAQSALEACDRNCLWLSTYSLGRVFQQQWQNLALHPT